MFHLILSSKSHCDDDISDRKKKEKKLKIEFLKDLFLPLKYLYSVAFNIY